MTAFLHKMFLIKPKENRY